MCAANGLPWPTAPIIALRARIATWRATCYIPVIIGLFFFLLGGGLAAYMHKTLVRVNDEGLVAEGLFGGRRAISWQDVVRAKFGADMTFALVSKDKKTVKVHFFMSGMSDFASMVEDHLPDVAKSASQADLKKLQATFGSGR
jgi:hypothetical protein